ncbi:MAG: PLP-dependent cysteine synthase family protein [Candidatus Poseidoniales archaeon]
MKLENIGNTRIHLIQSEVINPFKKHNKIYVKLESLNPTKSIKDRMVHYIVSKVKYKANSETTFISASSGNTASSLAYICNKFGFKCIVVTNDKCSDEKIKACNDYGAKVIITKSSESPDSPNHYQNLAFNLAKKNPDFFDIDQYSNESNTEAYYNSLGPEIWKQTNGKITHFITGGSTCGTIMGVGRYLKEKNSKIKIVLADPVGSRISDFVLGREVIQGLNSYVIEGVGKDSIPKLLNRKMIDSVISVNDKESIDMCHLLKSEENLHLGGSSGLNVRAAVNFSSQMRNKKDSVIVTIGCDSGEKYNTKIFNDKWLSENNFL